MKLKEVQEIVLRSLASVTQIGGNNVEHGKDFSWGDNTDGINRV